MQVVISEQSSHSLAKIPRLPSELWTLPSVGEIPMVGDLDSAKSRDDSDGAPGGYRQLLLQATAGAGQGMGIFCCI